MNEEKILAILEILDAYAPFIGQYGPRVGLAIEATEKLVRLFMTADDHQYSSEEFQALALQWKAKMEAFDQQREDLKAKQDDKQ